MAPAIASSTGPFGASALLAPASRPGRRRPCRPTPRHEGAPTARGPAVASPQGTSPRPRAPAARGVALAGLLGRLALGGVASCRSRLPARRLCRRRRAPVARCGAVAAPAAGRRTPLWTLKATQLLIFGANVCIARYITVYYDWIGLSRQAMSQLLLTFPSACFVGQLFWSAVVDRIGDYKGTMLATSFAAAVVVFAYLLPAVKGSIPLLILVTALHGFLASPSGPLVDALCLKVLAEQPDSGQDYGDQRLWSAVGWGAMALLAGRLVDAFGVPSMFFCYSALVGVNIWIIARFIPGGRTGPKAERASSEEAVGGQASFLQVLRRFEVVWLLVNLVVYGALMSLVENYLNIFLLQDFIGTPKVLLGLATTVMCIFEIPVFMYVSRLWKGDHLGPGGVIVATQCLLAVRCLLYAVLPRGRPWLVLLVEPMHGLTFAGMWCATVEYARRLAPPGTEAKMQALLNGLFYQISFGVGSLLWGFLVQRPPRGIGFAGCCRVDAALVVGWLVIWCVVGRLVKRGGGEEVEDEEPPGW